MFRGDSPVTEADIADRSFLDDHQTAVARSVKEGLRGCSGVSGQRRSTNGWWAVVDDWEIEPASARAIRGFVERDSRRDLVALAGHAIAGERERRDDERQCGEEQCEDGELDLGPGREPVLAGAVSSAGGRNPMLAGASKGSVSFSWHLERC